MRLGHAYVPEAAATGTLPADPDAFRAHLAYAPIDDFSALTDQRWVRELHAALMDLLEPTRTVLSLGSGKGEHELLLHRAGIPVTASELLPEALDDLRRLHPEVPAITFDALRPTPGLHFDDVLATGLDYALSDGQLVEMLRNGQAITGPGGRFVFALRYRDNLATRAIDQALLPAWAATRRLRGKPIARREHGWRRSPHEIRALAERSGYRVGRVRHAGYGMELARLPMPAGALEVAARLDRRLHVLNNVTVFELLAP